MVIDIGLLLVFGICIASFFSTIKETLFLAMNMFGFFVKDKVTEYV